MLLAFRFMLVFKVNIDDDDSRVLFLETKKKIVFGQMTARFGVFTVLRDIRCDPSYHASTFGQIYLLFIC